MEEKYKIQVRLRLAASLRKIINRNKEIVNKNLEKGIKNVSIVDGVRQLEAASRLSYTIVQGVFSAKRDLHVSTLLSLIEEGLDMSLTEFAKVYDSITDEEIKVVKKEIAASERKK